MSTIRLDRYLADIHIGSRRQIKEILCEGHIRVNGEVVVRAETHVDTDADEVTRDGEILSYSKYRYIMLNKPAGVVSATKDGLSKTVISLLKDTPIRGLSPVGRLDKDTEGLLLLTNDGELLHRLISPQNHVDKVYEVHLKAPLDDEAVKQLEEGVDIGDDTRTLPAKVVRQDTDDNKDPIIHLTIQEGRFHQIKRMMHAVGNEVVYLKRLSMGSLRLDPQLKEGAFRTLSSDEIRMLKGDPG